MGDSHFHGWILDVDGTLYAGRPVRWALEPELRRAGDPVRRVLSTFAAELESMRQDLAEPESDLHQVQIDRTASRTGVPVSEVEALVSEWNIDRLATWARRFRRRHLLRLVTEYRESGGRIAAVSDHPAERKLTAMGIRDRFDIVIGGGEQAGPMRPKPHPDGLLDAADGIGVEPEYCLVIGDRWETDGEAALRAGMRFQHISTAGWRPSHVRFGVRRTRR